MLLAFLSLLAITTSGAALIQLLQRPMGVDIPLALRLGGGFAIGCSLTTILVRPSERRFRLTIFERLGDLSDVRIFRPHLVFAYRQGYGGNCQLGEDILPLPQMPNIKQLAGPKRDLPPRCCCSSWPAMQALQSLTMPLAPSFPGMPSQLGCTAVKPGY